MRYTYEPTFGRRLEPNASSTTKVFGYNTTIILGLVFLRQMLNRSSPPITNEKEQEMHEEESKHISTNEVSKEGQILEEPQQNSQDIEARNVATKDTKTPNIDLTQKKTYKGSDNGKGHVGETSYLAK